MAVYIDDAYIHAKVGRIVTKWCHLTADSTEELVSFARKIGMKPQWIQHAGTWKEHFDVTETRRFKAVEHGAVEIGYRDTITFLQAKKNRIRQEQNRNPTLF